MEKILKENAIYDKLDYYNKKFLVCYDKINKDIERIDKILIAME